MAATGWVHRYLPVDKAGSLHYVEAGPTEGPLVMLVHGFPEFWYSWHLQIMSLAMAGYRVVVPDLRGFNESLRPKGIEAYARAHVVNDLVQLLEHCGRGGRAHLVGHGWGSNIVWFLAMDYKNHVWSVTTLCGSHPLVFEDSMSLLKNPRRAMRYWYWYLFLLPKLPETLLLQSRCARLQNILHNEHPKADAIIERHVQAFGKRGAISSAINYHRAYLLRLWSFRNVSSIEKPALVLWAPNDKYATEEMAQPPPHLVPHAKVIRLHQADYWMMWNRATSVNKHLVDFLNSHST